MIDQNRDGFIDIEDLKDMYASLGKQVFACIRLGLGLHIDICICSIFQFKRFYYTVS